MAEMDPNQLMAFIYQICQKSSSHAAAQYRLRELEEIMKTQNVNDKLLKQISDVIVNLSESIDCAKTTSAAHFPDRLQSAIFRAEERRKREYEAHLHGRC